MRQVSRYLIIGDGRVATHFKHYLGLLGIVCQQWSRSQSDFDQLKKLAKWSDVSLLLIADGSIEPFIQTHDFLRKKFCVHFSGKLVSEHMTSAHPLMLFGSDLYDLDVYQKIPFILEKDRADFSTLFPALKNPYYEIPANMKPFYHALCVMSGNFTCLLWKKLFDELDQTLNIPIEAAFPYLQQVFRNLQNNYQQALTGPLVRGDQATIAANLQALEGDSYQGVYQAFLNGFNLEKSNEHP